MLQMLIELQRLKRLERTGWMLRGLPNGTESVAAHSFGVAITAMLLSDELTGRGMTVDVERVLRMALMHDWAETRVGDMPRTGSDYFGVTNRKQAEMAAFSDIVEINAHAEIYGKLHQDYEERASFEARLVKAADVIDLLVQVLALERAGARGLDEFWEAAGSTFDLEGEAANLVSDLIRSLIAEREKINNRG